MLPIHYDSGNPKINLPSNEQFMTGLKNLPPLHGYEDGSILIDKPLRRFLHLLCTEVEINIPSELNKISIEVLDCNGQKHDLVADFNKAPF